MEELYGTTLLRPPKSGPSIGKMVVIQLPCIMDESKWWTIKGEKRGVVQPWVDKTTMNPNYKLDLNKKH